MTFTSSLFIWGKSCCLKMGEGRGFVEHTLMATQITQEFGSLDNYNNQWSFGVLLGEGGVQNFKNGLP